MNAGDLSHRVWVDEPVTSRNDIGEEVITWTPRHQIWCAIEPAGGQQVIRADERVATIDTLITARWSAFTSGITPKWRFRFVRGGFTRTYSIVRPAIEDKMSRQYLAFACLAFSPELS